MKVVKNIGTPVYKERRKILDDYELVDDDYDTSANNKEDASSYYSIDAFYSVFRFDYICKRNFLKKHVLPKFQNLDYDEQKELIRYRIFPEGITDAELLDYFTEEEQRINWKELLSYEREARSNRVEELRLQISYDMTPFQQVDMYLTVRDYLYDYIVADLPHLTLWFTNGTWEEFNVDFSNNGFQQKSYYSNEMLGIFVDILSNGNY